MLQDAADAIVYYLDWAVFFATVYAFVHAAMQRPDAYTAVDKLTKRAWMAILGGTGFLCLLSATTGFFDILGPTIAAVAAGVYLVDVRPKLLEVQGKSR